MESVLKIILNSYKNYKMPSLKIKSLGIKTKTFMINNSPNKKIIDIFNKSSNKPSQSKNKKYSNFKPIFSIKQKKLLC
jgi:hypothetical protein